MTSHELNLDVTQSLLDAPEHGHNRLHPEIPPALTVARGDTVTVDVRDGFDAQLRPGSSTADVLRQITHAPLVRCDEVQFRFLGISMAGWNAILSFGGAALILILSRRARRS